jgi:hypothetical protein
VRVLLQLLTPGVEHAEEADLCAASRSDRGDFKQRLGAMSATSTGGAGIYLVS